METIDLLIGRAFSIILVAVRCHVVFRKGAQIPFWCLRALYPLLRQCVFMGDIMSSSILSLSFMVFLYGWKPVIFFSLSLELLSLSFRPYLDALASESLEAFGFSFSEAFVNSCNCANIVSIVAFCCSSTACCCLDYFSCAFSLWSRLLTSSPVALSETLLEPEESDVSDKAYVECHSLSPSLSCD